MAKCRISKSRTSAWKVAVSTTNYNELFLPTKTFYCPSDNVEVRSLSYRMLEFLCEITTIYATTVFKFFSKSHGVVECCNIS